MTDAYRGEAGDAAVRPPRARGQLRNAGVDAFGRDELSGGDDEIDRGKAQLDSFTGPANDLAAGKW
jgi:hypothetical protein